VLIVTAVMKTVAICTTVKISTNSAVGIHKRTRREITRNIFPDKIIRIIIPKITDTNENISPRILAKIDHRAID
jgi:hypothetical protein